jgi:predicted DNA-binding protein (UPF0251 family)
MAKKDSFEEAKKVASALAPLPESEEELEKMALPIDELTDRQKTIIRLKIRGLSQRQIAKVVGVSQPMIHKEMKKIREHLTERGANVDQDRTVGYTRSIYEEVERRAWDMYHASTDKLDPSGGTIPGNVGDQHKALSLVLTARKST